MSPDEFQAAASIVLHQAKKAGVMVLVVGQTPESVKYAWSEGIKGEALAVTLRAVANHVDPRKN